jgi:glycosyltransferase involved in cell wall biosynthesis
MKIITAMYTLKKGGAYDRFIMMIEAFVEKQCQVHCLSLTPVLIDHPLYCNHVVPLPMNIRSGFLARVAVVVLFPFHLFLVGRRENVDLMVAFGPLYAFLQALPKRLLRRPLVTLIRLETSFSSRRQGFSGSHEVLTKIVEYVGLRSSDRIIAVNEAIREDVLRLFGGRRNIDVGVLPNNIILVPDGLPRDSAGTRRRFGIPEEVRLIATAGVLTRRKNFEILIRSLAEMEMQDIFLLIIGEETKKKGDYGQDLKGWVKRLNLQGRVIFTGWLEKGDLWRTLRAADLFVLPSTREGMPNVLLEALGCDIPCLGSDIPGIRDILQYEDLLFDPADPKAVGTKILKALSDARMKRLCMERKKVFLFNWKEKVFQMITETIDTWESLQKDPGQRLRKLH